jgi:hypothetical protein
MLAEIFLLRLEAAVRTARETASLAPPRFVPVSRDMVFKRCRKVR